MRNLSLAILSFFCFYGFAQASDTLKDIDDGSVGTFNYQTSDDQKKNTDPIDYTDETNRSPERRQAQEEDEDQPAIEVIEDNKWNEN